MVGGKMVHKIKGTPGNDQLTGTSGADLILGLGGNDTITGGQGADTIKAGDGNDLVIINPGDAAAGESLDGGKGVDVLELRDNADLSPDKTPTHFEILQIDGNNSIVGAQLSNFYTIVTQGNLTRTLTGSGAGTYDFSGKTIGAGFQFFGSGGADSIVGSSGAEFLSGGQGADTIKAGDGNDIVYVAAGDASAGEALDGGAGPDKLELGSGADLSPDGVPTGFETLQIDGNNSITGGQLAHFTSIVTQGNLTRSLTGKSAGTFDFSGKTIGAGFQFFGSGGADSIVGSSGAEFLSGGQGADTIKAGDGNDIVYVAAGDASSGEALDGGAGTDKLELGSGADLSPDGVPTGFETLQIDGNNSITGGQLAHFTSIVTQGNLTRSLTGKSAGTFDFSGKTIGAGFQFFGSGGADSIVGSSGAEFLSGGQGADTIKAGDGNDIVYVAAGDASSGEALDGGAGTDKLELGSGADLSPDGVPTGFETLQIDGNNSISGGQLAHFTSIVTQGNLTRSLTGSGAGTYDFSGKTIGAGFQFFGSGGGDSIVGSSGAEYLGGGGGNDTINAGDGNDTLLGGSGADSLTGGVGDDLFYDVKGDAAGDTILDFTGAGVSGGDVLELHGYGSGATLIHNTGSVYTIQFSGGSETLTIHSDAVLTTGDFKFS
ncbi:MAG: calcium-binding protein, partial [Rhodospirillales bacterium]